MTDGQLEHIEGLFKGIERHLDGRLDEIEKRVADSEGRMRDEMKEGLQGLETKLLAEFHKWASPLAARVGTHRHWFYEVDAEMELLNHRLEKLEGPAAS